jgi:hypothetical protein
MDLAIPNALCLVIYCHRPGHHWTKTAYLLTGKIGLLRMLWVVSQPGGGYHCSGRANGFRSATG